MKDLECVQTFDWQTIKTTQLNSARSEPVFAPVLAEYVAMYTYESSEQGDLSFQQGDVVVVTRKEGDWWTGVVGGKTGVFPSNYVKPRDSMSEVISYCPAAPHPLPLSFSLTLRCRLCFSVFWISREDGEPGKETRCVLMDCTENTLSRNASTRLQKVKTSLCLPPCQKLLR